MIKMIPVYSPAQGLVDKIYTTENGQKHIRIYIPTTANHKIHSPVDGHIVHVEIKEGKWFRTSHLWQYDVTQEKRGQVRLFYDNGVDFWIEVGEGYITHIVRFIPDLTQRLLRAQEQIGQIIIGSLAEVTLPPHAECIVYVGQEIQITDQIAIIQ